MQLIAWYREAAATAQGRATRIQWMTSYILALLDNTPDARSEIDAAVAAFAEVQSGT